MISFQNVSVHYDGAAAPALARLELTVPEGELCLVVGPTGAGKSTLLGLVNGSVPHFTGGTLTGRVLVDGRDTRRWRPRDLADVVGVVSQDPVRGFVTDRVVDELAFTMSNLALSPWVMRRRVEDTLDLLGLEDLRDRPLATLSGGQQQRVAIGAALAGHPRVLVLDEPTSALDPAAAEEVLAALHRLVHDLGVTVLLAEHRLERVIGTADSVLLLSGPDAPGRLGPPAAMMADSPVVPPVVELGRWAGWQPLPLTVRDARRLAGPLRAELSDRPGPDIAQARARSDVELRALVVGHRRVPVAGPFDLRLAVGQIVGLMGRNGSGKSTLLWSLAGALPVISGRAIVSGREPSTVAPPERRALVALVPQQPADLLYRTTVAEELSQADRDADRPTGAAAALLTALAPGIRDDVHPRDLSEGQRLMLVLALQLCAAPTLLLLDEPTRGLDYPAKRRLRDVLDRLAAAGTTVLLASHDVEFVAATCAQVLILAGGQLIADGPTAEVVTASPTYAPQTAKVFAPLALLTADDVVCAAVRVHS